jgi:hypothetical protein
MLLRLRRTMERRVNEIYRAACAGRLQPCKAVLHQAHSNLSVSWGMEVVASQVMGAKGREFRSAGEVCLGSSREEDGSGADWAGWQPGGYDVCLYDDRPICGWVETSACHRQPNDRSGRVALREGGRGLQSYTDGWLAGDLKGSR